MSTHTLRKQISQIREVIASSTPEHPVTCMTLVQRKSPLGEAAWNTIQMQRRRRKERKQTREASGIVAADTTTLHPAPAPAEAAIDSE